MHPLNDGFLVALRIEQLHDEARRARLAASAPARSRRGAEEVLRAWRHAVGFRLVEAGLRLVVGRSAHPPSPARDWGGLG